MNVVKRAGRWFPVFAGGLMALAIAGGEAAAQVRPDEGGSWYTREGEFSRMTPEEQRAYATLLVPEGKAPIVPSAAQGETISVMAALPSSFDWRDNGGDFVTNVRDQGTCGACWAFAATAALESKVLIGEGTPGAALNLSEQILLSCSGAGSCDGGYLDDVARYVRDRGTAADACYPYSQKNGLCGSACANWEESAFRVRGFSEDYYYNPTPGTANDPKRGTRKDLLKNLVYTKGPTMVAFTVYSDFYSYDSGVYRKQSNAVLRGYHAVTVVGWKDTGDPWGGHFIVKNSWGDERWGVGEGGFFKIAYDQLTSGQNGANFAWWIVSLGDAYRTAPLPDLLCSSGDISLSAGAPLLAGDPIQVEATVRNAGSGEAGASTARLFLSPKNDTNLADDTDAGIADVAALAAGAEAVVQWSVPAPEPGAQPVTLWPIVRADDGGAVAESNETNNVGKAAATVTVEPPAWVHVKSPNGGKALYRGKTYAFTWGASNCGTVTVQLLNRVGGSWLVKKTLGTGLDATLGTVAWKVGKYFPTGSYYKAKVVCDQDGSLVDESDARFSIKAP